MEELLKGHSQRDQVESEIRDQKAQASIVDLINSKVAKIKTKSEVLSSESELAKELVYSMKVNFWIHDDP